MSCSDEWCEHSNKLSNEELENVCEMWSKFGSKGEEREPMGLKAAQVQMGENWAIGNTLVMTVAFAEIMLMPTGKAGPYNLQIIAHHVAMAYAMFATIISVWAIMEIATVQEDLVIFPSAFARWKLRAQVDIQDPKDRSAPLRARTSDGCWYWTRISLSFLMSSAFFLVFSLNGVWSLIYITMAAAVAAYLHTWRANLQNRFVFWRAVEKHAVESLSKSEDHVDLRIWLQTHGLPAWNANLITEPRWGDWPFDDIWSCKFIVNYLGKLFSVVTSFDAIVRLGTYFVVSNRLHEKYRRLRKEYEHLPGYEAPRRNYNDRGGVV